MKLTQANFDKFCENQEKFSEALNHRMTSIEKNVSVMQNDLKWIKKIGWVTASAVSTCAGLAVKYILFS